MEVTNQSSRRTNVENQGSEPGQDGPDTRSGGSFDAGGADELTVGGQLGVMKKGKKVRVDKTRKSVIAGGQR